MSYRSKTVLCRNCAVEAREYEAPYSKMGVNVPNGAVRIYYPDSADPREFIEIRVGRICLQSTMSAKRSKVR